MTLTLRITCVIFALFFSNAISAKVITVEDFVSECRLRVEPCAAFVMGVVEGARNQTREHFKSQPFAFLVHNSPVCLPNDWGSQKLTQEVLRVLIGRPDLASFSAVSGILVALSESSSCDEI